MFLGIKFSQKPVLLSNVFFKATSPSTESLFLSEAPKYWEEFFTNLRHSPGHSDLTIVADIAGTEKMIGSAQVSFLRSTS